MIPKCLPIRTGLAVCWMLVLPCSPSLLACQTESPDLQTREEQIADVRSVFDVAIFNAQAWIRGDVIVVEHYTFDNVNEQADSGLLIERTVRRRMLFDYEGDRFASLNLNEYLKTDFSKFVSGEPERSELGFLECASMDFRGGIAGVLGRGGRYGEFGLNEQNTATMKQTYVRDFRGYWLARDESHDSFRNAMKKVEAIKASPLQHRVGAGTKKIEISFVNTIDKVVDGVKMVKNQARFEFDAESSMPILQRLEKISEFGESYENFEIRTEWKAIGEVYVPSRIVLTQGDQHESSAGMELGTGVTEFEFQWNSLNEPLDESFFDGSLIIDRQACLAALELTNIDETSESRKK